MEPRKPYPSDVSDDEWAFVAPYLALVSEDAKQRVYPLREVFDGLRYIVKTGGQWRWMPHDLPPWPEGYQQTRRWRAAGRSEAIIRDLRAIPRPAAGRAAQPSAAAFDSQTLRSAPERGGHAGYDGALAGFGSSSRWPVVGRQAPLLTADRRGVRLRSARQGRGRCPRG